MLASIDFATIDSRLSMNRCKQTRIRKRLHGADESLETNDNQHHVVLNRRRLLNKINIF